MILPTLTTISKCFQAGLVSAGVGTTQANCYQRDTYRSAKTGTLYLHVLL